MLKHIAPGLRSAAALMLVSLLFVAFAAACSEPTPTPTPTPRPTPTPTPTATPTPLPPTPTPAPEPTPDAMMPKPEAGSIHDLVITETTTVGDLMATLSESEVSCLRDAVGAATIDAVRNIPIASAPPGAMDALPFECLTPENTIGISIAMMSASIEGGLSTETRKCITDLAMENPAMLGLGAPSGGGSQGALELLSCMTEEEAAAFAGEAPGDGAPSPEDLRCVAAQPGGQEALEAIMSGNPAGLTQEQAAALGAALAACNIDTGGFSFPPAQ